MIDMQAIERRQKHAQEAANAVLEIAHHEMDLHSSQRECEIRVSEPTSIMSRVTFALRKEGCMVFNEATNGGEYSFSVRW